MDTDNPTIRKCFKVHWKGWLMVILVIGSIGAMLINDSKPCRALYLVIVMCIAFEFELYPAGLIGMFPLVSFPMMSVMDSDKACSYCFRDSLLHFILALMVSSSMSMTRLNLRVGLAICKFCKSDVKKINMFLFIHAFVLAMLVPPTVTIAAIFPFIHSILSSLEEMGMMKVFASDESYVFDRSLTAPAKGFYISLAYAINIGSSVTQMSSTTNVNYRDEYNKRFPDAKDKLEFGKHLNFTIGPAIICAIFVYIYMQWAYLGLFRQGDKVPPEVIAHDNEAGTAACAQKLSDLGPMKFAEGLVACLVLILLVLIASREPQFADGWGKAAPSKPGDTTPITVTVALLFALPANLYFMQCWNEKCMEKSPGLIGWKYLNTYVAWSLIFIVGSAGTLAEGCRLSGLGREFGEKMSHLNNVSKELGMLIVVVVTMLITNISVNAAVMEVLAPGLIQAAVKSSVHPLYFGLPAAFMINIPYLTPQSSGPNALVCAYGRISTLDMLLAGAIPTLFTIIFGYLYALIFLPSFYGDITSFPKWINESTVPDYGEKSH